MRSERITQPSSVATTDPTMLSSIMNGPKVRIYDLDVLFRRVRPG